MRAVIMGLGWITARGAGRPGQSDPFVLAGTVLPAIDQHRLLPRPLPHFGRLDAYTRLGLAATALALRDAGQEAGALRETGIVCTTRYGCLQTDLDFMRSMTVAGGRHPSPALFAYTLPSALVGEAGILFGLTGPAYVTASESDLASLELALESLSLGEARQMLAGWCDAGRPEGFPPGDVFAPGAVICLMTPAGQGSGYGVIDWRSTGGLCFDGTPLRNLADLVVRCIEKGPMAGNEHG